MKNTITQAIVALLLLTATGVMADVNVGGNSDVSPADPTTWTTATTGYVGHTNTTGTATLSIDENGTEQGVTAAHLIIGNNASTTGQVDVSGLGGYLYTDQTNNSLTIGHSGSGSVNITDMGSVVSYITYIGRNSGSSGTLNVTGDTSGYTGNNHMYVGYHGDGVVDVRDKGRVYAGELYLNYAAGGIASVIVDGAQTQIEPVILYVGHAASGGANLTITNEASVITTELYIDHGHNGNSFIDIASDGKLGFFDPDKNINNMSDFLAAISGDAIRFWSGSEYVSYTTLTEGQDYEVIHGTGLLDGYTLLTTGGNIPEPATLTLISIAAVGLLRRRKMSGK